MDVKEQFEKITTEYQLELEKIKGEYKKALRKLNFQFALLILIILSIGILFYLVFYQKEVLNLHEYWIKEALSMVK